MEIRACLQAKEEITYGREAALRSQASSRENRRQKRIQVFLIFISVQGSNNIIKTEENQCANLHNFISISVFYIYQGKDCFFAK